MMNFFFKGITDQVKGFYSLKPYIHAQQKSWWNAVGTVIWGYVVLAVLFAGLAGLTASMILPQVFEFVKQVKSFSISQDGTVTTPNVQFSDEFALTLPFELLTLSVTEQTLHIQTPYTSSKQALNVQVIAADLLGDQPSKEFSSDEVLQYIEEYFVIMAMLWTLYSIIFLGILRLIILLFVSLVTGAILTAFPEKQSERATYFITMPGLEPAMSTRQVFGVLSLASLTGETISLTSLLLYGASARSNFPTYEITLFVILGLVVMQRWMIRSRLRRIV